MRKLVVTGGAGFIGSNFVRLFLEKNRSYDIVNIDKLTYSGNNANVKDLNVHPRHRFVRADICDRAKMNRLLERAWGVVNFAAETHVDRSIACADEFLKTNVLGVHTLLEATRKNRIKRFLHISTDEVCGSVGKGSAKEDAPLRPNNPYSASKAAGDLLVRSYVMTHKFPAMVARSSNNYGPYQYPEKVIPLFVTNLLEGKKVPLYSRGQHMREWLFVLDNAAALDLILHRGRPGEIYNVGGAKPVTNLELTKKILKVMGVGLDRIQRVKDRPGHDFRYCLNTERIRGLGFRPSITLENGLKRTADWYRTNTTWWRPLKNNVFTVK